MKILLHFCTVASFAVLLAFPVVAGADEAVNYAKDAEYAEGTPPMIPHRFKDTSDGEYCLGCHRTGVNGAPMSPHPVRLSCTGCHGQGEIKEIKPLKKGQKKNEHQPKRIFQKESAVSRRSGLHCYRSAENSGCRPDGNPGHG